MTKLAKAHQEGAITYDNLQVDAWTRCGRGVGLIRGREELTGEVMARPNTMARGWQAHHYDGPRSNERIQQITRSWTLCLIFPNP